MGRSTTHSWSHSRSSALAECPRRYFFEYFAEGEPEDRDVWRLKDLTTLPMWAGAVVDFIISRNLGDLRSKGIVRTDLAAFGLRRYWAGLEASKGLAEVVRERARPKAERSREPAYRPLVHHYYRFDLGRAYEEAMAGRVAVCLQNFEESETLERIRSAGPENWGSVVRLDEDVAPSFDLHGHKVYAALDFWFREGDDLHVLDWKTGSGGEYGQRAAERQLAVYALYAAYELRQPISRVHTQAVWLQGEAQWKPEQPTKDRLRQVRDEILAELREELAMLDVRHYRARSEYRAERGKFPARPTVRGCLNCRFREICPEGTTECAHVATSVWKATNGEK